MNKLDIKPKIIILDKIEKMKNLDEMLKEQDLIQIRMVSVKMEENKKYYDFNDIVTNDIYSV